MSKTGCNYIADTIAMACFHYPASRDLSYIYEERDETRRVCFHRRFSRISESKPTHTYVVLVKSLRTPPPPPSPLPRRVFWHKLQPSRNMLRKWIWSLTKSPNVQTAQRKRYFLKGLYRHKESCRDSVFPLKLLWAVWCDKTTCNLYEFQPSHRYWTRFYKLSLIQWKLTVNNQ